MEKNDLNSYAIRELTVEKNREENREMEEFVNLILGSLNYFVKGYLFSYFSMRELTRVFNTRDKCANGDGE